MIGKTVAHYRITEMIGAGGMGEVFRAADSKLGRDVALKMLPAAFAQDAERMARFQREAQVLASLNHPNIGAIYGLEESDDSHFLVLEIIEGPTLFDRLTQGPVPLNEALEIAKQIAEAVEFAHESGVVHRDLKPSNVKVTEHGRVKVLDFGLAKALEDPAEAASGMSDPAASPTISPSISPTLQSPITGALTGANVILGTAAYMSPEQARGKRVDKRADIWAFGVILWEMLTGRRLFDGETVSDTLAAVLRKEPEWDTLPPDTPPNVRRLLRRCLARDPKDRLRDIGDARIVIEDVLGGDLGEESATQLAPAPPRSPLPRILAGVVALVAVVAAFLVGGRLAGPAETELPLRKFVIPVPDLTTSLTTGTTAAISPDGSRIAYASEDLLWVRDMDQVEPRNLAGTEGATKPFWSPDGEWLAYGAGRRLWKVRATGGEPSMICDLSRGFSGAAGGVWRADGQIVFCDGDGPLLTVSSQGGDVDTLLALDPETDDDFHNVTGLPGDRAVLFVVHDKGGNWERIDVLADGVRREILRHDEQRISAVSYSPTGHLVYHREPLNEGVWAAPFSLSNLEVTGKPFLAIPEGDIPHVATDGTLVHAIGARSEDSEFLLVNRDGSVDKGLGNPEPHEARPFLSPDARRVVAAVGGENDDIWILDIERDTRTRLTFDPGSDFNPVWSPDGTRVYYAHGDGAADFELRMRAADGTGEVAHLGRGSGPNVSADGRFLIYAFYDTDRGNWDIHSMPLGEDGLPTGEGTPFLATDAAEWSPVFSPAGDYVAYSSAESGQSEIYVKRFPGGEGKWQLTTDGGSWPRWSAAGDELYFAKDLELYAVPVRTQPSLQLGTPAPLFTRDGDTRTMPFGWPDAFDVSADGRFLVVRPADTGAQEEGVQGLIVTQNWFREFRGTQ
jgi:serine/threonine-protein kinase